jgi:DNA-binding FadR family transcriptional regulator
MEGPDRSSSAVVEAQPCTDMHFDDHAASTRRGHPKLAEETAMRIEAEIMRLGWPEGTILGSEPALIERFGVSRAVFREAVRIVEHHGAARMRKGPGGGLLVTVPDPISIQRPATLYLDYANVSTADLFSVRSALELPAVAQVAAEIDENNAVRLRDCLAAERSSGASGVREGTPHNIHILLAEMTGNAAFHLFVTTLAQLTYERTHELGFNESEVSEVHRAHQAIVDAVIAGDAALAQHRMRTHLSASIQYYRERESPAAS